MRNQSTVRVARWTVLAGIAAVIVTAFLLSFSELDRLGATVGWSGNWAALFPITIDLYALISTLVWVVLSQTPEDRRRAAIGASAAVAFSIAGNTIEHLYQAHVMTIGWPVVVTASAIPPVVMALAIHVAVRALAVETAPADTTAPGNSEPWSELDEDAKLARVRDAIRALSAAGQTVTGKAIGTELGVTDRTGRTYLSKAMRPAEAIA